MLQKDGKLKDVSVYWRCSDANSTKTLRHLVQLPLHQAAQGARRASRTILFPGMQSLRYADTEVPNLAGSGTGVGNSGYGKYPEGRRMKPNRAPMDTAPKDGRFVAVGKENGKWRRRWTTWYGRSVNPYWNGWVWMKYGGETIWEPAYWLPYSLEKKP